MWIDIEEWRPDINLYKIFFSWQNSSEGSAWNLDHWQREGGQYCYTICKVSIIWLQVTTISTNKILSKRHQIQSPQNVTKESKRMSTNNCAAWNYNEDVRIFTANRRVTHIWGSSLCILHPKFFEQMGQYSQYNVQDSVEDSHKSCQLRQRNPVKVSH